MSPELEQAPLLPGCISYAHHESSSIPASRGFKLVFQITKKVEGKCVTGTSSKHC